MATPDLTRFDFHALKFIQSEDVSTMSAEEVGQYILLLIRSWLIGKDASLPDDLDFLAREARVKKVSDRVLKKFPVVQTEHGLRRRNSVIYGEWLIAIERSASAVKAANARWGANTDAYAPANPPANAFASEPQMPKPNQSEPSQINPIQHGSGTFKFIAVRYSSFFGINHSHSKKHIEKYQNACARFGEDLVLSVFDRWAAGAGWLKERRDSNGLNFFWKPMEEIIEGDQLRLDREESVRKPDKDLELQMAAQIVQENLENEKTQEQERENRRKQKEFEAAHANEI